MRACPALGSAMRAVVVPLLCAASLAAVPARARDLTPSARAALADTVRRFEAATKAGDGDGVVDVLPPSLLADMARQGGAAPQDVRSAAVDQFRRFKADGYDTTASLDLARARFASLGDGTPYVLIPSHTVVVKGARTVESRFVTLALMDGGRWSLVAASTPERVAALSRTFPNFSGVDLGTETIKAKP